MYPSENDQELYMNLIKLKLPLEAFEVNESIYNEKLCNLAAQGNLITL